MLESITKDPFTILILFAVFILVLPRFLKQRAENIKFFAAGKRHFKRLREEKKARESASVVKKKFELPPPDEGKLRDIMKISAIEKSRTPLVDSRNPGKRVDQIDDIGELFK